MPDNPDYLQYDSNDDGNAYVYGVEYNPASGQPLKVNPDVHAHNAPCAVCMAVSRCSLLMPKLTVQSPGPLSMLATSCLDIPSVLFQLHMNLLTKTQSRFQDWIPLEFL